MSCQIKQIAIISKIPEIRRCLFPTDDSRGSDSWLHCCEISISPTGETIVFANKKRLVVVTANWLNDNSLTQFEIDFLGSVHDGDVIQSVLCLPIVGSIQNSKIGPDWICIAVGFESGYVRFYTEDCKLLLAEQFHNETVCSLKCQSQHSPRPDISTELKPEEIYVGYPSNICIINGQQLFATLKNCRNQLHSGQIRNDSESALGPNSIRKWGFQDQFLINDTAMVGLDLANTFDHLMTASICGGFDTRYRAMPPNNSLILASGSKPFVGFHYAIEGGAQPVFSDVAKAVANKLKSALPGWLTGGKAQVEKQLTLASNPVESMGCRFGLCDLRRVGSTVILSPDKRLAAISDQLGRVILVDTHRGVVLRMFKGYREAQCGFVQVPDEKRSKHKSHTRVALFLIIYTPKKGTIEIFSAQTGLKITTFSATKFSCLIYVNYGLFGFTSTTKSKYVCQLTCVLLDPDGALKDFVIPFHYALTEKNSRRVRDVHLYKRLKLFIKTADYTRDDLIKEALNTCSEFKTSEIRLQCLEMLGSTKEITEETVHECAKYFLDKLSESAEEDFDCDTKSLKSLSENLIIYGDFYRSCLKNDGDSVDIDGKISLGEKELKNLQKLLEISCENEEKLPKVTFEQTAFTFSEFFSVFDFTQDSSLLKTAIEQSIILNVSSLIFKSFITGTRTDFENLKKHLIATKLSRFDLLEMILNYWIHSHSSVNLEMEMNNLNCLIHTITQTGGINEVTVEYNEISSFWEKIREILAESSRPFQALTAALICRCVAQRIECEKDSQQTEQEESFEIWEKMSQENCKWSLLIGKLEDISLLNIILLKKPSCIDEQLYSLPKLRHEPIDISLKYILDKGKGVVSELVARWLTSLGINPDSLIGEEEINEPYFNYLQLLKKQFPYSLNSCLLLANICWEYALSWKKDPADFSYLEAAIECLRKIPSAHIQQGMFNLIWNAHLKIIFEASCKLINKVGKLPKEKLCKQDTGLSDFQIASFIGICTDFLDTFMDTVQQSYNSEKMLVKYENIWENGGQSLVDLAQQHDHINYDLLHAHYQLSSTLQMITVFNVKHTKPINNLFDNLMIGVFFTDLQLKTQINWYKSDSKIHSSRTQFLLKVISASIETVTVNGDRVYSKEHVHWMGKIVELARVWNLEIDVLRRFQITQLFTNGFDDLAEELIPTITETNKLGTELVRIAGKRMQHLVASSQDLGEKIAALSPTLTQFFDESDSEWCAPVRLESILSITAHSLRCLHEDVPEYKIGCQLLEACSVLQDIER